MKAYPPQQLGYPPQQGYPPNDTNQPGAVQFNQNAPTQTVIIRQTQASQPSDYLAFAIIVTICCCLPFGIVAIVKSGNVRNRFTAGDVAGAEEASRSAKGWSIAGLVIGIVSYVIGIIAYVLYFVFVLSIVTAAADDAANTWDNAWDNTWDNTWENSFFDNL